MNLDIIQSLEKVPRNFRNNIASKISLVLIELVSDSRKIIYTIVQEFYEIKDFIKSFSQFRFYYSKI